MAAVAEAVPAGRPGPPDAAVEVAAAPAEAAAEAPAALSAAPAEVEAAEPASLSAASRAGAVVAVAQPAVRVQRARPAEWALEPAQQVWLTVAAAAVQRPFVCRALSGQHLLRTPPRPERSSGSSSPIWFLGRASRWGSLRPERVRSCPAFSGYPQLRRRSPVRSETASPGSRSPICFPG